MTDYAAIDFSPLDALTGDEVVLRVEPVDPIDPFRGAYVDLAYPDLPQQTFDGEVTEEEQQAIDDARGTAYVPLSRQGEVWVGGPVQRAAPAERFDPRRGLACRRAADRRDVGARLGERQRDALADPGVGPGHRRDPAGKVERAHLSWQMSSTFMSV